MPGARRKNQNPKTGTKKFRPRHSPAQDQPGNWFEDKERETMRRRITIRGLLLTGVVGLLLAPCAGAGMRPRPSAGLPWNGSGGASGSVPWNIVVLLTL